MTRILRVALIIVGGFALMVGIFLLMLIMGGTSDATPRGAAIVAKTTVSPAAPVEITAATTVEGELTVTSPLVGEVVTSPLVVTGTSAADQLGYRLYGASSLLAEGSVVADGVGGFSTTVEFVNTCCIEMMLEVFQIEPGSGPRISVPLAFPENS